MTFSRFTLALFILSSSFLLFSTEVFSQAALNLGAKKLVRELSQDRSTQITYGSELQEHYDLIKSETGDWSIGVLAIVDEELFDESSISRLGLKNDTRLRDLWTFRVPISRFEEFRDTPGLLYIEVNEPVEPDLQLATIDSRTDSVNNGLGLPRAFKGDSVIIAVIDWGFDYTHPVFYDSSLTELRISRAWDQNKLSGPAPDGYSFGTEYVGMDQLLAGEADTLYVFGPSSHGTHVAGIAGGNGGGTVHRGAAPNAELIMISLRRDGPSLVDAFQYVADYAASVGKPFVVNMSFGSHLGPHDGSSLKNYGIDMLSGPGRIFVGSAGNNGTDAFHLDMNFLSAPGDTMYTVVIFGTVADIFGQTVSMWGSEHSSFGASILLVDSNNEIVHETPFHLTSDEPSLDTTEMIGGQEFRYILESDYGHFLNDKPSFRFEIRNQTPHKVVLKVSSEDSHVHMWNCMRHNRRFTNWGQPFTDDYPGAVAGDILYGVGEPAGVGRNVITVGSYVRTTVLPNGNEFGGVLSPFSSSGPTVDGRVKPFITSTGHNITSAVNSFDESNTSFAVTTDFEGKTYGFRTFSGTSMSGPMVAGIVALLLEVAPQLSHHDIMDILKETARLDQHTGELPEEGHLRWGHGKANALAAILSILETTSTNERNLAFKSLSIYPNPAVDEVFIQWDDPIASNALISLYDMEGKLIMSEKIQSGDPQMRLDVSHLAPGTYILSLSNGQSLGMSKVMISR